VSREAANKENGISIWEYGGRGREEEEIDKTLDWVRVRDKSESVRMRM